MKKVSVVKPTRWAVGPLLIAGGILAITPQAHAAHWEMGYKLDGKNDAQSHADPPGDWNEGIYRYSGYDRTTGRINVGNNPVTFSTIAQSSGVISGNRVMATSALSEGSITIYLKWVQDTRYDSRSGTPPTPTPTPKKVFLRITGYAKAHGSALSQESTGAAKFGPVEGKPSMNTHTFDNGQTSYANYSIAKANGEGVPYSVVIPLDVPEGGGEVEHTFALSAKGTSPEAAYSPGNMGGASEALLDFRAETADFGLSLSRTGAPTPKVKGAPGVTIDESKDEWIDAAGEGHGHSIYSYKTLYTEPDIDNPAVQTEKQKLVPNNQSFSASAGTAWVGYSAHQWSPSDETDHASVGGVFYHSQEMPFGTTNLRLNHSGSPRTWEGTPMGNSQKVISFTLTDSSVTPAISEKRQYNLTLHDPWEIVTHHTTPFKRNYRAHPNGSWTEASEDDDTLTGQVTEEVTDTVGVTFGLEPSKLVAPLVGIDVELSRSYTSGVAVGNEHINVRKGYRARVMIWDAVIKHYGTANEWNAGGYAGLRNYDQYVPENPAAGMHLGPLEWGGNGPEPEGGPIFKPGE